MPAPPIVAGLDYRLERGPALACNLAVSSIWLRPRPFAAHPAGR